MLAKDIFLSVVIPVYNEKENVAILHREIVQSVENRFKGFEILFIDDGSRDGTDLELNKIHESDPRAKVVRFRKNFGQSAAISAGFEYASGDIIVTMDADLQNDPADIPNIVGKLNEGYDMVNGWRRNRRDKLISRKIPSFFGNKLVSFITKVKLHDYGCSLRAFRKDLAKNLKLYGEMHRYLPAYASRLGIRSIEIPVNHRKRRFGSTKYGIGRTYRVILDLISLKYLLSYSHRPLQIFGGVGFIMMMSGMVSGAILTYEKFFLKKAIAGRPLLFFTILVVFLGFQLITLGLIADMLSKIYHEGLNKDIYSIRETLGFEDHENFDDLPRALL